MFVPKGHMAPHTRTYRVRRQYRTARNKHIWGQLEHKGDDGVWRVVKRYATLKEAYEVLIRLFGHGDILEE